MSQPSLPTLSITHHFANLTDPRLHRRRRHRHQLLDIIAIAICGVICGCKSWGEIAVYGRKKADWLQTFLELPGGLPSKDTFRRVFARIKPAAFPACFRGWMQALATTLGVKHIGIDGKTVRRSPRPRGGEVGLASGECLGDSQPSAPGPEWRSATSRMKSRRFPDCWSCSTIAGPS